VRKKAERSREFKKMVEAAYLPKSLTVVIFWEEVDLVKKERKDIIYISSHFFLANFQVN